MTGQWFHPSFEVSHIFSFPPFLSFFNIHPIPTPTYDRVSVRGFLPLIFAVVSERYGGSGVFLRWIQALWPAGIAGISGQVCHQSCSISRSRLLHWASWWGHPALWWFGFFYLLFINLVLNLLIGENCSRKNEWFDFHLRISVIMVDSVSSVFSSTKWWFTGTHILGCRVGIIVILQINRHLIITFILVYLKDTTIGLKIWN